MSIDTRCRLCGVKCQEYLNIFENEGLSQEIHVKIFTCLQITILKEDVLPKIICSACCSNLKLSYDFFTKSHMAQLFLQELYESITNAKENCKEVIADKTESHKIISRESKKYNNVIQLISNDKSNVNENAKEHELTTNFHHPVLHINSKKKKYNKLVLRGKKAEQQARITECHIHDDTIITSSVQQNIREDKLKARRDNGTDDKVTASTDKLLTYTNSVYKFCLPEIIQGYQWTCAICENFHVDNFLILYQHYKSLHNQEPPFKCNICDKVYDIYGNFIKHLKLHSNFKQYKCTICDKTFSRKGILLSHQSVHSNERPHACSNCGKSFKTYSSLQAHKRLHLPEDLKERFICEFCKKQCSTKHNLMVHLKLHTGERNFMCDICGKSFITKGSLIYHITAHAEDKNFKCKECNKSFKTAKVLSNHLILHSTIKPYQCDVCGKQFHVRRRLQDHNRIHTGDMPYKCEHCGKSFRFSGILKIHKRQHTGERPYNCSDCLRSFTNWSNYNKHMKRIHHSKTANLESNKHKKEKNVIKIKSIENNIEK